MIGAGIRARRQPACGTLAIELRLVESPWRSVHDVPLFADERIKSFDSPLQLAAHHGPELGEVSVHVAAIARDLLQVFRVPVDKISTDAILALGRLAPRAFAFMGRLQILDID